MGPEWLSVVVPLIMAAEQKLRFTAFVQHHERGWYCILPAQGKIKIQSAVSAECLLLAYHHMLGTCVFYNPRPFKSHHTQRLSLLTPKQYCPMNKLHMSYMVSCYLELLLTQDNLVTTGQLTPYRGYYFSVKPIRV